MLEWRLSGGISTRTGIDFVIAFEVNVSIIICIVLLLLLESLCRGGRRDFELNIEGVKHSGSVTRSVQKQFFSHILRICQLFCFSKQVLFEFSDFIRVLFV